MDAVLEEQQDEFLDTTWVRDAVLREQPTNMALQRLQSRVLKNSRLVKLSRATTGCTIATIARDGCRTWRG